MLLPYLNVSYDESINCSDEEFVGDRVFNEVIQTTTLPVYSPISS